MFWISVLNKFLSLDSTYIIFKAPYEIESNTTQLLLPVFKNFLS